MDFPLIKFDPGTGLASVGIPKVQRPLRGIKKLVQIVVIAVLKNRGQDVFTPQEGSGLRAMIGQFNYHDPNEIKVEILQRVQLIQQEMIQNQAAFTLAASERLRSLQVLEVAFDDLTGNTAVRLKLTSEAGQTTTVVV